MDLKYWRNLMAENGTEVAPDEMPGIMSNALGIAIMTQLDPEYWKSASDAAIHNLCIAICGEDWDGDAEINRKIVSASLEINPELVKELKGKIDEA